jgi:hypothetical protein
VPTYAGGMFEGLMANLVVPETTWGTRSLGLDDLRWAEVQEKYATQVLHNPVWGSHLPPARAWPKALRSRYPGINSSGGGFYDAVNPTTGSIGHRRLVLDQSMIVASLDDALNHDALQRYFARDPVSWAARLYLSYETMSIG